MGVPDHRVYRVSGRLCIFKENMVYEIDRAIEADNNGENPYSYVAQRDTSGHGTLMASISAGSYTDGYVGVAPGAELLVVFQVV